MNARLSLVLVACSGTLASAQNVTHVSVSWSEMLAGTNTPVLHPNGIIEPGEGALIQFGMYATRNGSNVIGQSFSFTIPNGATYSGTARGLGSFVFDVVGNGADASGTWNTRLMSPIFNYAPQLGFILEGGARVHAINSAQIAHGGAIVDPTNPIVVVWRGVWNPASYDVRTVHFAVEASDAVPVGQQNAVNIEVGPDPVEGYPMYMGAYFQSDFGPGVDIPIGPPPSGLHSVCYPNCDGSSGPSALNVNDFVCYINLFAAGNSVANCDGSIRTPLLTANDFMCYLNRFTAPCS